MDNNETPERDLPLLYARKFIDAMLNRLSDDEIHEIWDEIDPDRRLSYFGKAEAITLVSYVVAYATTTVSRPDIIEMFEQ